MPDFFSIIGFQRSGSTFLYNLLDQHPDILMNRPQKPEPKFFLNNADELGRTRNDYLHQYFPSLFTSDHTYKYIGDKSTSYCEHLEGLKYMKKLFPAAKIVLILRNPVERAISNYKFSYREELETRSLEDVFIRNVPPPKYLKATSVDPFNYIQRGEYLRYIRAVLSVFERNNVYFVCFEYLRLNRQNEMNNLLNFLGMPAYDGEWRLSDTNSSGMDLKVPSEVQQRLYDRYKADYKMLEVLTGLDLPW